MYLKPYFYVLNNILRQILYSKGGDSTYLRDDSQKVLDRFGPNFDKFSISRYIWNKIHSASEDPVRHYSYAPYLMHVIEKVSGIQFPTNSTHTVLKIANKVSIMAARELKKAAKGKGKGASGSTSRSSPPHASRSHRAHSEDPVSSSSSDGNPLASSSSS